MKAAKEHFKEWQPNSECAIIRKGWWYDGLDNDGQRRFFWTISDMYEFAEAFHKQALEENIKELEKRASELGNPTERWDRGRVAGIEESLAILNQPPRPEITQGETNNQCSEN